MVTAPSLNGVPCLSPTALSGAITVGGELAGLLQHGIDHVFGEIAVKSVVERALQARRMLEREGDVGDRRAVGHIFVS